MQARLCLSAHYRLALPSWPWKNRTGRRSQVALEALFSPVDLQLVDCLRPELPLGSSFPKYPIHHRELDLVITFTLFVHLMMDFVPHFVLRLLEGRGVAASALA